VRKARCCSIYSARLRTWDFLEANLDRLKSAELYRTPDDGSRRRECIAWASQLHVVPIDASSNDYLGYAGTVVSRETSDFDHAMGAGASRLIHGTRPVHTQLETMLSDWLGLPASLLFSAGYAANVGILSSLPQQGDLILSDSLNHASIIDGCRLSKADVTVFPHLDLGTLQTLLQQESTRRRSWVVTESYFSMDGDSPDLGQLRALCDQYGAPLLVDEAHALGVFGPQGSGLCRQFGVKPDVLVGTFGKALGTQGAFACSSGLVRDWLWNRARSFVYSTATSPFLAQATLQSVHRTRRDDTARRRLFKIVADLRQRVAEAGVPVLKSSHGPIVPVIMGTPERAVAASEQLLGRGILVQAIRPPTVSRSTSRLRVTLNATLTDGDVQRLADAIVEICAP
jgi:8-amino-7-oxononanoate synthase